MNCSELTNDRLLDYADWELPPHERNGVARHLETCDSCRTRRDDLEGMAGALRHDLEGPPPGLLAELDAAVLGRARTPVRRRSTPWRPFLAGAAAALVVAALAWLALQPGPSQ